MNLLIWLTLFLYTVEASPGDKLKRFKRCFRQCKLVNCVVGTYDSEWEFTPFNEHLKVLYWTCDQDCDYQCQRIITAERRHKNKNVLQFHGKWPFHRVYGIQELVSMVFSIGNLIPHAIGLKKLLQQLKTSTSHQATTQTAVLIASCVITCCAWVFSSIFHVRDFLLTERLDYFFAGLTVLSGLYAITSRYFRLFEPENLIKLVSSTVLFISVYSMHVYRLVTDWSYTYNMQANVIVGIVQNLFMVAVCFGLYSQYYHDKSTSTNNTMYAKRVLWSSFFTRSDKIFSLYPIFLGTIVILGMSLEIFDFSPVFHDLVDAHSLWHLVTIIPASYGWYEWLIWDIRENITPKQKTQ
ncbi:Per1-like protein [Yamadazyma tenuis ATCC 10573]|uniref:Post-GPI attachment to proteins factor 3 n=1 Tax=Candida tenuis (strain ATCC 10573 / BCRC 21748 / CBS 615 / JCM 9827 / NBRC 10315 / NRRL Y-1498 / VKM Y-70) TaxID=590646 RepID=G3B0P6_CANTC|nr:Per1-like protein [Yamadazyma tenuis ATCC 10573]EGV65443.1 Per1-like protein [Yamadazyma tenuis ATCC 10573]